MFSPVPDPLPDELVEVIDAGQGSFRLERIVSRGHVTPPDYWYDQEEDEWVWLLCGAARLEVEPQQPAASAPGPEVATVDLGVGDYLLLPAHTRHRVVWTDPEKDTVWLAVFLRRR